MENFNIIVTVLGSIILSIGLGSRWLQASPIPPTIIALAIGVILGPEVTGLVDLSELGNRAQTLVGTARLTLGIGLVGVALRVPREYPWRNYGAMAILVLLGMLLMWCISTILVYLFMQIPFWLAELIGAAITATDPIAATPIVTGRVAQEKLPDRIRYAISFESGANDGLSYLFVFLPMLILTRPQGEHAPCATPSTCRARPDHSYTDLLIRQHAQESRWGSFPQFRHQQPLQNHPRRLIHHIFKHIFLVTGEREIRLTSGPRKRRQPHHVGCTRQQGAG